MTEITLPVNQVHEKMAAALKELAETGRPIFITRHSRAEAVVLSIEQYNAIMGLLEDREDEMDAALGRRVREEREAYGRGEGQGSECRIREEAPRQIARTEAMETRQVVVNIPEKVLLAEKMDEASFARELQTLAAVKLYEMGRLSSGRAADLAGMTRVEFLLALGRYRVFPLQAELLDLEQSHG